MPNTDDAHPGDTGCEFSRLCVECPFTGPDGKSGGCVKELRFKEQQLIANGKTINNILACYDCGMKPHSIHRLWPEIPVAQISSWCKHKEKIRTKINKYCKV